jgi:hypothetical protein
VFGFRVALPAPNQFVDAKGCSHQLIGKHHDRSFAIASDAVMHNQGFTLRKRVKAAES